jgi:outer membrane lipoprotein-sorting protein
VAGPPLAPAPFRVYGILVLALLLALPAARPARADWRASWESIQAAAQSVRAVEADFVQEKHLRILSRPLMAEGAFAYRAPGDLRWEYRTPVRSLLLSAGGRVQRFVERGGALTADESLGLAAVQVVVQDLTRWLTGRFDANPDFAATLAPGGAVRLTPRRPELAAVIAGIELQLAPQPGVIEAVTILEDEGNFTRLLFTNVRLPDSLPDARFQQVDP